MAPAYAYHAVDARGKRDRGRLEATSATAAARSLEAQGLVVLDVDAVADSREGGSWTGSLRRRREVLEVTRTLAALLPAGMPLARALATASNLATGRVAAALGAVRARVERGEAVAAALSEHPALFPPVYVGLVRAGERSGDLAGAFRRLAEQLEREDALRSRLVSASIYPALLALAGGIAVLVLLLFVLPRFVEMLQGAGAELPRSTALVLGASALARRFWPLGVALAAAAGFGVAWCRTTDSGRRFAARILLGLPLVRAVRREALGARFSRLAGVLLDGGAPLLHALDGAAEGLGDPIARDEAERVRSRVREGGSLKDALAQGGLFPPILHRLVAVGEESGRLGAFLEKAAEILEDRTQRRVERLVTLAEPAMIVVFGGIIGLVALALLQAVYGINAGAFR